MLDLRSSLRRTLAASPLLFAALLGACADATGPSAAKRSGYLTSSSTAHAVVFVADTSRGTIRVGPAGGTWIFGENDQIARGTLGDEIVGETHSKIHFPANSVCDMSKTNYLDWGKPCTPISSEVAIAVKWWVDANGHPQIDFATPLRFQPTKKGEVSLYLKDAAAAQSKASVIKYCPVIGLPCVGETWMDDALVTKRDSRNGWVYRVIRHFSGYNVWA